MHQAVTLAGLILLREYFTGGLCPRPGTRERLRSLLRPLAGLDQPLMPALGLDGAIAELEALFPARAAHLTRVASAVEC